VTVAVAEKRIKLLGNVRKEAAKGRYGEIPQGAEALRLVSLRFLFGYGCSGWKGDERSWRRIKLSRGGQRIDVSN
jgi:hypothetical protein